MLVVATLPAVVVGLGLKESFDQLFGSERLVAGMLLVTGAVVALTYRWRGGDRRMTWGKALLIGCAQAVAIMPGVSRAGMTIVAALILGIVPREAVRFSFLMSMPAIGGGLLLALKDGVPEGLGGGPLGVAAVAAFVSALVAIWMVRRLVDSGRLWVFAPYCLAAGAVLLVVLK
jgi:undecaprenyl-diphosphatase